MKSATFMQKLIVIILACLYVPFEALIFIFSITKDVNAINNGTHKVDGQVLAAAGKTYSLDDVKALSKKRGTTINDMVMSCVAIGLRNYCTEVEPERGPPSHFSFLLTSNLRFKHYERREDIKSENSFVMIPISKIPLDNIENTSRHISKKCR